MHFQMQMQHKHVANVHVHTDIQMRLQQVCRSCASVAAFVECHNMANVGFCCYTGKLQVACCLCYGSLVWYSYNKGFGEDYVQSRSLHSPDNNNNNQHNNHKTLI